MVVVVVVVVARARAEQHEQREQREQREQHEQQRQRQRRASEQPALAARLWTMHSIEVNQLVLDLCGARARGCPCALAGERAVERGARAHQGRGHRRERGGRAKVRKASARTKQRERRGLFEERREARPPDAVDPARGTREMAGEEGRVALSERRRTGGEPDGRTSDRERARTGIGRAPTHRDARHRPAARRWGA